VRRLIEYEQMKLAAHGLNELPQAERDFDWVEVWVEKTLLRRLPEVSVAGPAERLARHPAAGETAHPSPGAARGTVGARAHGADPASSARCRRFRRVRRSLRPDAGAPVLVVHFLALLELAREHLLEMTQVEAFAPIYLRLADVHEVTPDKCRRPSRLPAAPTN
jgi:segregation and condensation protein A